MNIIPAIDLQNGRCVRLLRGDFARQTEYSTDPLKVACDFERMGFTHLHVVDLDGALSGKQEHQQLVREVAATTNLDIQLGGGIRNVATLESWLNIGVTRCVLGSVAINDSATVKGWISSFGPDRIVLALDVRIAASGVPILATDAWTRTSNRSLWQCLDDYCTAGAMHVLCTDISRDGAMTGPNIALYSQLVERYPQIQLQASGGVRSVADLGELSELGATAAITGRAMLNGSISPDEIRSCLPGA